MEDAKNLVKTTISKNNKNITIWGGFLTTSLIVYFLFSSGDFSFLLTYASFMRCFGFGILTFKMFSGGNAKGVSAKSLQLYALVFLSRLCAIMRHQGYLPYDKSGDWFYHFVEAISLASTLLVLYLIFVPLRPTYSEKYDKFGNLHIPNEFGACYILVPALLCAIFFHPTLNSDWFSDVCWTLSMYLESTAILPQLYMFQKQASDEGGVVEALMGHTVFALGFSRLFEFIFWATSFRELMIHGNSYAGWLVMLSQIVHLAIMGDFFYYYFKSISSGSPMELPATNYSALV